jgi:hypothetical protein
MGNDVAQKSDGRAIHVIAAFRERASGPCFSETCRIISGTSSEYCSLAWMPLKEEITQWPPSILRTAAASLFRGGNMYLGLASLYVWH